VHFASEGMMPLLCIYMVWPGASGDGLGEIAVAAGAGLNNQRRICYFDPNNMTR
jgi:hypothetical protein